MSIIDYHRVSNEILEQAIEGEEKRIADIKAFLEVHPLDTDINKTVALELKIAIKDAEINISHLRNPIKTQVKGGQHK